MVSCCVCDGSDARSGIWVLEFRDLGFREILGEAHEGVFRAAPSSCGLKGEGGGGGGVAVEEGFPLHSPSPDP